MTNANNIIKVIVTPTKKEKIKLYVEKNNFKSISSFVDIATDFYMSKELHAGEMATSFCEVNQCISSLEQTCLKPKQQFLVNKLKEGMDNIHGYFQD